MNLIIDGIEIIGWSSFEITQSYEDTNNGTTIPMSDGSTLKNYPNYGEKLSTTISGSGWLPAGIDAIDFNAAIVIDCLQQRSIASGSSSIDIPGEVRDDIDPEGFAIVDESPIKVNSSFSGGTLSITATPGATQYVAAWQPRLTVYCSRPIQNKDIGNDSYSWSITGVEVSAAP